MIGHELTIGPAANFDHDVFEVRLELGGNVGESCLDGRVEVRIGDRYHLRTLPGSTHVVVDAFTRSLFAHRSPFLNRLWADLIPDYADAGLAGVAGAGRGSRWRVCW